MTRHHMTVRKIQIGLHLVETVPGGFLVMVNRLISDIEERTAPQHLFLYRLPFTCPEIGLKCSDAHAVTAATYVSTLSPPCREWWSF